MDGLAELHTRLLLEAAKLSGVGKVLRKQTAIMRIRAQPFYGDYFKPVMGDKITIRRPFNYVEIEHRIN